MRAYSRVGEELDEYEEDELDQYEDAEGEDYGAEEEEEEEDPAPKKEVLDYLVMRQKFKEAARKKLAKENGSGSNSRDRSKPQLENFGSFFGPSQPVIADRVIQESKSYLETRQNAPRVSNHQKDSVKGYNVPIPSAPKNGISDRRPLDPIKTKMQKLKDTRDYSFLQSDDADIPVDTKNPPGHSNSDTRSAQVLLKSKEARQAGRNLPSHGREDRRAVSSNSLSRPIHRQPAPSTSSGLRPESRRPEKSVERPDSRRPERSFERPDSRRPDKSLELKKQPSSSHASRPGHPGVAKDLPVKKILPDLPAKKTLPVMEKKTHPVHIKKKVVVTSLQRRGSDSGSIGKQSSSIGFKGTMANGQRSILKSQNGVAMNPGGERRGMQEPSSAKVLSRQNLPSSKPQAHRQQIPSHGRLKEDSYRSKPKPGGKPARGYDKEEDEAISEIRKLFKYDPRRFADDDDDLSDMEADFRTIQMEERRSARIAQEEDERELKLIQEEEERERRRKLAKRKR